MSEGLALSAGERMLWEGRPHGIRGFLRPMDLFLIAFALFAALFFVTAIIGTARQRAPDPSGVFVAGLFPLIFFGLFFFGPRFLSMWRESRGGQYIVTSRRIVIRNRGREIELDLTNLPYLELERSWLSGETIFFSQRNIYEGWGGFYGGSSAPALRGLSDARAVYRTISDARAEARQR